MRELGHLWPQSFVPPMLSAVCPHRPLSCRTSLLCGCDPFWYWAPSLRKPVLPSFKTLFLPHLLPSTIPYLSLSSFPATYVILSFISIAIRPSFSLTRYPTSSFPVIQYSTASSGRSPDSSAGVRTRGALHRAGAFLLTAVLADTSQAWLQICDRAGDP